MPIDRFTQNQFETFLSTLSLEIRASNFDRGEFTYDLALDPKCFIRVRSSIDATGLARDTGDDSIRLIILDSSDRYITKTEAYVTRVNGWQGRLEQKIDHLANLRRLAGDCPSCHKPHQIFLSTTERNPNRWFIKCPTCSTFNWLDTYKPVFFDSTIGSEATIPPAQPPSQISIPEEQPQSKSIDLDDFLF